MFCQKCGALLVPKKQGNKTQLVCSSCGHSSKEKKTNFILKEKVDKKTKIEVVDKKIEPLPKVDEQCPKCKFDKAYYWVVQTRASDEGETLFFKCTRCEHTWRKY